MNDEQASEAYFKAVNLLNEVVDSAHRGDRDDILEELESDLE